MLNDLRIDKERGFVYITDSGIFVEGNQTLTGALIVLDINQQPYKVCFKLKICYFYQARRLFSGWNITINNASFWLTIDNEKVLKSTPMRTGADGIALSPDKDILVVCPISSHLIWKINTSFLRNFSLTETEIYQQIEIMGKDSFSIILILVTRNFASDGLIFGNLGNLILGSLEGSAIIKLN